MRIGGRRLVLLSGESRLGEESRDDGLEERERGEMGLPRAPPPKSSVEKEREQEMGRS